MWRPDYKNRISKKYLFFSLSFKPVHLLQNWIENKIHLLQNAFILQNEFFLQSEFFLTELNFLKGDTNIHFKEIPSFEKKKIL